MHVRSDAIFYYGQVDLSRDIAALYSWSDVRSKANLLYRACIPGTMITANIMGKNTLVCTSTTCWNIVYENMPRSYNFLQCHCNLGAYVTPGNIKSMNYNIPKK